MNKISKTFRYGDHQVTIETGRVAKQASGSVMIYVDDTVLLVTAVAKKEAESGRDFFPLTVDYREKTYAAGKIPGGYFKREGRPTEKETLTSRLIDRPLRPTFADGFTNEVQVVATLLSLDPNAKSDVAAIIGSSAAVCLAGLPFNGPVAAARVGYIDGEYVLNPNSEHLQKSQLDLVVAGTENAVLMVESEASELSEEVMLGAVIFGHQQMQVVVQAIKELVAEAGTVAWDWTPPETNHDLIAKVSSEVENDVIEAYKITDKMARQDKLAELRAALCSKICVENDKGEIEPSKHELLEIFHNLEKKVVRSQILSGNPRIDGRDTASVRNITVETGVLPRVHGSALFTRGETQALVVATLGTERDGQVIDDLEGEYRDNFMLHYNFPPYSVGEVGFMSGPKRREIGHGRLARRALQAMVPTLEEFPYVLRVVSEITESNGSSSMASVCGTSLALMDAGVPIKNAVAGIAMGLIKESNQYAILTDILGDEDHLGDMDFKVAGTENGVTALQMDIKISGITKEIMKNALEQARDGRMHILKIMNDHLRASRESISQHAPKIIAINIPPKKIGDVIGKGGATIRDLTETFNCTIDISDEGVVKIAAVNTEEAEKALERIKALTADVEVGKTYEGPVVKIMDFGAFVELLPGKQGLVHISQIAQERVNDVNDYLKEGQVIRVKVIEIDRQGRVRLSMKEAA